MAGGALGQLSIKLSADTAQAISDIGKAATRINRQFQSISRGLGTLTAGFLTLGGVAGIGAFVKRTLDAQDELSKLSQKITVSVETLAGLRHAADLAGVSGEALTKGFKTLSSQMFDSSMGLAESKRNFAALGVQVQNTDGTLKDTQAVMLAVADKFAGMSDGAAKSALAVKLFGKTGLDMIPMLNEGSAAIASMIAEGQRLNPVTAESAKQAEIFNDNMTRLGKSVSAVGINILNDLLPSLSSASEFLAKAALSADGFWKSISGWALTSGSETAVPATAINEITTALIKQREQLESHRKSWMSWFFADDIALLLTAIKANEAKLAHLRGLLAQREPKDNFDLMGRQKVAPVIVDEKALEKAAKQIADRNKRMRELDNAGWVKHIDTMTQEYEDELREMKKIDDAARAIRERDRAAGMQAYFKIIDDQQDAEIEAGAAILAASKNTTDEMTEFWKSAAKNMQGAMSDFFFDVMQANLSDLGASFKRTIDRMVADVLAAKAATALFGKEFGSGGAIGGIVGQIASIVFGPMTQSPAPVQEGPTRAAGGSVFGGSTYLVGERGPELFTPAGAGMITPNYALGGVTINMNVNTPDANSFRASRGQIIADMSMAMAGARRNL